MGVGRSTLGHKEIIGRSWAIRKKILELSISGRSAHVGSALSCVDILNVLFHQKSITSRNRIILSKGHAAMALYATAIAYGYVNDEIVETYLSDGSSLWGHPTMSLPHDFIDWSTGSLGHGLPVAAGMAYSEKFLKQENKNIDVVLSDGELNEGSNWEAFLFISHHKLESLRIWIDYNKIQSFGFVEDVMALEPLIKKFASFGFATRRINGHNVNEILGCLDAKGPIVIVADTIKGKGVRAYENTIEGHYRPATTELLSTFIAEGAPQDA